MWEVDKEGLYIYSNSVVKRILGYEPEEIVGKKHFYDFFTPYTKERLKQSAFETFARKKRIRNLINPNMRKDGRVVDLLTNGLPILNKDGSLAGYRGVDVDVTAQKLAERQLQNTNDQLAAAIARLKEVQHQIIHHERLAALWQMAGGIAHKFNNALMPILGHADLMLTRPGILDDRHKTLRQLREIHSAAKLAAECVHWLREFSRTSDETEFKSVDPARLVDCAIRRVRPRIRETSETKGAAIRIRKSLKDLRLIKGNESQLVDAFAGIILNSIEAMPEGGDITIYAHPDESGRDLEIKVRDTGIGMTDEISRRAIEPFFTSKGDHGAGLGLAMAHGVIRRHNGSMDIQSTPGKGTVVTFALPAAVRRVKRPAGRAPAQPVSRILRVLFIDDEQSVRDVIARYLEFDNHIVELAANGEQGIRRLKKSKYDLVITDWAMPGMNGDRVAAAVKSMNPGMPVIMLTGFGDIICPDDKPLPNVDMVLSKPVTRDSFKSAIAKAIAKVPVSK